MENSTKPIIVSLALLYNNNQLADPDLWDGIFTLVLLLRINEFLTCNAQNITCSLLRISIFIKQHLFGNKLAKDFLELVEVGFAV